MIETTTPQERALLFGALLPQDEGYEQPLAELARLADTAGARVEDRLFQKITNIHPRYYVGSGFAHQLADRAEDLNVDVLIADNDLSPAQARNLENLTGRRVIDRSQLILDIFASHAQTKQAKIQVELAQLQYTLPRLKRRWTHLDRVTRKGGGGGAIGFRGPGEKQIETDRRLIQKKISDLRGVLKEIQKRKEREVEGRASEVQLSLVGYTNAGKSTLMNALTEADVHVEDRLFATLDTRTRTLNLEGGRRALISDTVGFISKIPHHLIASFHATLEEVHAADLLLHVVDASQEDPEAHIRAVREVLDNIGAGEKPVIYVLNKIDAVADELELSYLRHKYPNSIPVSARNGDGIPILLEYIKEEVARAWVVRDIEFSAGNGKLYAFLHQRGEILSEEWTEDTCVMKVRLSQKDAGQMTRLL